MKIAIITGASSGLGREFVRRLALEHPDLSEIWAIARRRERLEALQALVSVPVRAVPLDLAQEESIEALEALLAAEKPEVRILVSAAGFGKIGSSLELTRQDCDAMIDLNCRAAVDVTMACLPYLPSGGRILELCSTAGFQPFPYLNVYAATKSFLYRYSRALGAELRGRGITVTAVCPYWVKDTEFIPVAQQTKGSGAIRHFPLASTAEAVVRRACRDSRLGLPVSTPGPVCTIHRAAAKVLPSSALMGIWELLRRV